MGEWLVRDTIVWGLPVQGVLAAAVIAIIGVAAVTIRR